MNGSFWWTGALQAPEAAFGVYLWEPSLKLSPPSEQEVSPGLDFIQPEHTSPNHPGGGSQLLWKGRAARCLWAPFGGFLALMVLPTHHVAVFQSFVPGAHAQRAQGRDLEFGPC